MFVSKSCCMQSLCIYQYQTELLPLGVTTQPKNKKSLYGYPELENFIAEKTLQYRKQRADDQYDDKSPPGPSNKPNKPNILPKSDPTPSNMLYLTSFINIWPSL